MLLCYISLSYAVNKYQLFAVNTKRSDVSTVEAFKLQLLILMFELCSTYVGLGDQIVSLVLIFRI